MNGSRRAVLTALSFLACLCALAGDKKSAPTAIIAGTVFRDPGFALPEAKVVLMLRAEPKPKKLQEATTNYRGEFLFHVPPKEATYLLRATFKGYRLDEKEAKISGEEHIDVNLVLQPQSK
jgi:hypothetical protein